MANVKVCEMYVNTPGQGPTFWYQMEGACHKEYMHVKYERSYIPYHSKVMANIKDFEK